jgi:hypothetical protein
MKQILVTNTDNEEKQVIRRILKTYQFNKSLLDKK